MWYIIFKKEFNHFFNSFTGALIIILYLLINGIILFVNPASNVFDIGYANLDTYFNFAPWLLCILIPCITMKSFSEEYQNKTFEILQSLPISTFNIVLGKWISNVCIFCLSILPTFFYAIAIQYISSVGGIDIGAVGTSYVGLFLVGAIFISIGLYISSITNNSLIALLLSMVCCFLLFFGINFIGSLILNNNHYFYYFERIGIQSHYVSMQRGYILSSDIVYFIIVCCYFIFLTVQQIKKNG